MRHYRKMIKNGESPALAEMCALRVGPSVSTEDTFMRGVGTLDKQFTNHGHLKYIVQEARKQGYNPSANDFYNSAFAERPGDPKAFLKHGTAKSQIKQVCEERGWGTEGIVNVKAREPEDEQKPVHKLNPRIVERIRREKIAADPSLAHKDQRELREAIIDKHGAK